jgi:hypothetical protein
MNVLEPFEVAEIQVWPFWEYLGFRKHTHKDRFWEARRVLNAAEFTVFQQVIENSKFGAVLNEKQPPKMDKVSLPESHRGTIIPPELYQGRKHPDVRIARRASTIAALARVISERQVQPGLRQRPQITSTPSAAPLEARLRYETPPSPPRHLIHLPLPACSASNEAFSSARNPVPSLRSI